MHDARSIFLSSLKFRIAPCEPQADSLTEILAVLTTAAIIGTPQPCCETDC
jgi:hypothetical protein